MCRSTQTLNIQLRTKKKKSKETEIVLKKIRIKIANIVNLEIKEKEYHVCEKADSFFTDYILPPNVAISKRIASRS